MILAFLLALQAPEFTRFEFARERVGHRVVADALLVNLQDADLADARVVVVYFDRDLELKRSKPVVVPRLVCRAGSDRAWPRYARVRRMDCGGVRARRERRPGPCDRRGHHADARRGVSRSPHSVRPRRRALRFA